MNTILLWAVPVALALALALVGWVVLRRRPRQGQRQANPPPPPPRPDTPMPPPVSEADGVAAQHQAATEALRQARRRKSDDEIRLAAARHAPPTGPRPAATGTATAAAAAAAGPTISAKAAATPTRGPVAQPTAPRATVPPPPFRPPPPVATRPEPVVPVLSPLAIQLNTGRAPPAAPAGLAPLRTPPRPTRPPTVLVADDSKVVRVKTGRLLEKLGWRVLLADDGQAALRCLEDETPDLLITDVEMPGLDGFALTRHLRGHPRWARLPVIMITSSDDKHRAEAIAVGVNVLLGKPYAEEALIAQARSLLGTAAVGAPALH